MATTSDDSAVPHAPSSVPSSWEDVRHPDLPRAASHGTASDYAQWVLDHADEDLLQIGVVHIPLLSDEGAAALADVTSGLLGAGGDGVGSMHNYGALPRELS